MVATIWLLPLLLGDRPAYLVALAAETPSDPFSALVTYGPLGIMVLGFATGQIRTKFEVVRIERQLADEKAEHERRLAEEKAEVARLRQELAGKDEVVRAILQQVSGHTLPALAQSARVFEAIPNAETDLQGELRRVNEVVESLTRQIEVLNKGDGS